MDSTWGKMSSRFYRKREIYTMIWDNIELGEYMVCAAPWGGPVAMVRDDKQVLLLTQEVRPIVRIYTSAGALISEVVWDKRKLVKMGWSNEEQLVCVLEDGQVMLFSIHGELLSQFLMGSEANSYGVVDACIWGTGLVVLTARNQLFVSNFDEPRPKRLADTGLEDPPTCMVVLEPQHSSSGTVEVFLGTVEGSILVVDEDSCNDQMVTSGPFSRMSVSADGAYVAAFTTTGAVWVSMTDFSRVVSEISTQIKLSPKQLVWCGSDSVILYWDELLLMVGPSGEYIKYSYDEALVLVPEIDGCRVISDKKCEFIQMVPNSVLAIFQIGSTAPAALLYDAMDAFEKKSAKADENIRAIKGDLAQAVDDCVDAASHEFQYPMQKSLLKAASFGKCFCEAYPADYFVEICKILRVLNAVRHHEIGIPLTIDQYRALTPVVLIDRLINAHHHLLAFKICQYLKIKPDRVLIHWACAKVKPPRISQTSMVDNTLADIIVEKLSICPGISCAEIAATAYTAGKPELARILLDYEPRPSRQVPLLISMKQDERALVKAVSSGDTDLVYFVLLHLRKTQPLNTLFDLIHDKPVAIDLLVQYCKLQDIEMLKTLYYHLGQREKAASICVSEAYSKTALKQRLDTLKIAQEFFNQKNPFLSKATEEQILLLQMQSDLEKECNPRGVLQSSLSPEVMNNLTATSSSGSSTPAAPNTFFIDKSVSETLYALLVLGKEKQAEKIRDSFKVPDKRFYFIKIKALVHSRLFDQLEKFAVSKKSPVGYAPFAEICIENGHNSEAAKYISMIPNMVERVRYYMQINYLREAADVAVKAKDADLINQIRAKMDPKELDFLNNLLKGQ
eukprot:comp21234_c0_seq1/m.45320 comp21234_c0_seq1/g.45320  ORF comp21234_c0_seq1/g.45320 comp21234_c0_seq1/m.45320 type:complete len:848 (+) comp21234_c0_seq1:3-2546(+)